MERPYILHMFTPGRLMSPFDINMAADAGYQVIAPYTEVDADAIAALVQDTIFSRSPKGLARTGIFIGGRDALVAADLLDRARKAMFKPFLVSLMADPSGAYTTAAAMVACVEAALKRQQPQGLEGQRVVILGGTGPVGRVAGVIAAQAGAEVYLSSRNGIDAAEQAARETGQRFGVSLHGLSGGHVWCSADDRALVGPRQGNAADPQAIGVRMLLHRLDLADQEQGHAGGEADLVGRAAVPDLGQGLPRHVLHGQVALAVGDAEVEDVDQVLLRELGDHLGLVEEALGEILGVPVGLKITHDLEGADPGHPGPARDRHEHLPHAAFA